jgi:hypothetical protein
VNYQIAKEYLDRQCIRSRSIFSGFIATYPVIVDDCAVALYPEIVRVSLWSVVGSEPSFMSWRLLAVSVLWISSER